MFVSKYLITCFFLSPNKPLCAICLDAQLVNYSRQQKKSCWDSHAWLVSFFLLTYVWCLAGSLSLDEKMQLQRHLRDLNGSSVWKCIVFFCFVWIWLDFFLTVVDGCDVAFQMSAGVLNIKTFIRGFGWQKIYLVSLPGSVHSDFRNYSDPFTFCTFHYVAHLLWKRSNRLSVHCQWKHVVACIKACCSVFVLCLRYDIMLCTASFIKDWSCVGH